MSHEIRTPMNGVLGMTELLLGSGLNEKQRRYAETVRHSGDALLAIINDILDFSKIESGKMTLEETGFELLNTVEDALSLFTETARAKGLELASLVAAELPGQLSGDPGRLRQVLVNLVGNAIKFTEAGQVIVRVQPVQERADRILLRFTVEDSGIGIPAEAQERIFEQFSQADESMSRRYGGTGLGLTIVRQLVEMMGGSLGVSSEQGAGSTFWFTVQLKKLPPREAPPPSTRLQGMRVLIVDGNAASLDILRQQTALWGMPADTARNAREALELLRGAGSRQYRLAILDLALHETEGGELARAIQSDPVLARLPLLLIAPLVQRGEPEHARGDAGAGILGRPLRQSQLYAGITSALGLAGAPAPELPPKPQHPAPPRSAARILLVEDNLVNQEVGMAMLEGLGCRATLAGNGAQALAELARDSFDLVLMDCQMPEMDGYQATRLIRAGEAHPGGGAGGPAARLPVIALTAHAMMGNRDACLEAGMDDYLTKPFTQEGLRLLLARWLPERAALQGPAAAPADGPAAGTTLRGRMAEERPTAPDPQPARQIIDESVLDGIRALQRVGRPNLLDKMILHFCGDSSQVMKKLRGGVEAGDVEEIRGAAHSFKSSSAYLGALHLAELCKEIETAAREEDPGVAAGIMVRIEAEYAAASQALACRLSEAAGRQPQGGTP